MPVAEGTHPRKGGDGRAARNGGDETGGPCQHVGKPLGRRGDGTVLLLLGRRPQENIAVHRRRHEDALSLFGRTEEQRVTDEPVIGLIEHDIFTAARPHTEGGIPHKRGDLGRSKTGGIDDVSGAHAVTALRYDGVSIPLAADGVHTEAVKKRSPVVHCIPDGRHRQLIGADNTARTGKERAERLGANGRLLTHKSLTVKDLKPLDTVVEATLTQGSDGLQLILREGHHKRAVVFIFDRKLTADLRHHARAKQIEMSLFRPLLSIKAGMNDPRIGAAGPHGNVGLGLKQTHVPRIARKLTQDHPTDDTATDDCNIVHTSS